jgi:hypothetical protein
MKPVVARAVMEAGLALTAKDPGANPRVVPLTMPFRGKALNPSQHGVLIVTHDEMPGQHSQRRVPD